MKKIGRDTLVKVCIDHRLLMFSSLVIIWTNDIWQNLVHFMFFDLFGCNNMYF